MGDSKRPLAMFARRLNSLIAFSRCSRSSPEERLFCFMLEHLESDTADKLPTGPAGVGRTGAAFGGSFIIFTDACQTDVDKLIGRPLLFRAAKVYCQIKTSAATLRADDSLSSLTSHSLPPSVHR